MDKELLQKVQQIQMEIMDEIHAVCVKNNITYYIIGGTALGAARHRGFIPWDIDIDIAMIREDYDRFIDDVSCQLPTNLSCISWRTSENYVPPHALVALNGSTLTHKDEHLNPYIDSHGIFVDIFPLDNVPKNAEAQQKQAEKIARIKLLKQRKVAITFRENSEFIRLIKRMIRLAMFPVSMTALNQKLECAMTKYQDEDPSGYVCSMASQYSYKKQCMKREIYGTPTLVEFSGREYFAPENLDAYLTQLYGDYMKEPTEEAKQKQMDYFVDASW